MKQENKNKDMLNTKQESNKILLQGRNKNWIRLWQENIPKIDVEQIKGSGNFFFLFIPLGHLV
jgi:hypothetical protein